MHLGEVYFYALSLDKVTLRVMALSKFIPIVHNALHRKYGIFSKELIVTYSSLLILQTQKASTNLKILIFDESK